jgi:hypothetical protein
MGQGIPENLGLESVILSDRLVKARFRLRAALYTMCGKRYHIGQPIHKLVDMFIGDC